MTTTLVPPLTTLVDDLDDAVRRSTGEPARVDAVSHALGAHLRCPGLLRPDQRVGDPAGYRAHLLHSADDGAFSLLAIVWLPGQTTPIHDHLSWCVVGVHAGEEHETRYRRERGRLVVDGTSTAGPGTVTGLLPPGDIHRVTNSGDGVTISLHVYGVDIARLGSSILRRYDEPVHG